MPDLNQTVAALQQLSTESNIEVVVEPGVVRVIEHYRGSVELTGSVGQQQNQWQIELRFNLDTGEYTMQTVQSYQQQGVNPGQGLFTSSSTTRFKGRTQEFTFERGTDRSGSYQSNFRSDALEREVTSVLEAQGWRRKKGFWEKLFSRD
ncbi:MAG: hypothetical protein GX862_05850 [Leucobacter sp.]|nr:hypothetical protein [Leucobacter sp.]